MKSYEVLAKEKKRGALRRLAWTILFCVVIGLPLMFWAARRFERALIFHPQRYVPGAAWKIPEGGEDVWFESRDGTKLHGWFVRSAGDEARDERITVIYFHGNGGNLNTVGWLARSLASRGFDVLMFDYRGYGRSEGGVSDEAGLYDDAEAAYNFAVRERGASPARLVLYGQSLGTTAVAELASRKECGAIILESGLSSASDVAAVLLPRLPRWSHRLTRNRFESARKLAQVKCSVLVTHGARDTVIPVEQGHALYAAAREPKELIILEEAGHNDMVAVGGNKYLNQITGFVRRSIVAQRSETDLPRDTDRMK